MIPKKPKVIIEDFYNDTCIHLMVRIDKKSQIKFIINFLRRFIVYKKNLNILKIDLYDLLKLNCFFSVRIVDKISTIDYLIIDEEKVAFVYIVIVTKRKYFKKITSFNVDEYFET